MKSGYKLVWSESALADLRNIIDYLTENWTQKEIRTFAKKLDKRNVRAYGVGHVTKFNVNADYLMKFEVQKVGGLIHNELWVPAHELEEFNNNIVGLIELIETHTGQQHDPQQGI